MGFPPRPPGEQRPKGQGFRWIGSWFPGFGSGGLVVPQSAEGQG